MKKCTFFSSVALLALLFIPQTIQADCSFTPQVFIGQEAGRPDFSVDATVRVGEGGLGQANIKTISSTDQDVVKAFDGGRSNFYVFAIAAGSAQVTYTENGMDGRTSCTTDHVINYTVQKGIPTAYFRGLDGSAATELTVAYTSGGGGEAGGGSASGGGGAEGSTGTYVPSPLMQYKQFNTSSFVNTNIPYTEISYNSTNPAVATISETGTITVNGLGQTTLSASWPGNDNWEAATPTLVLNVKQDANIHFNPGNINDTIDNVRKLNVVCPEGVTIDRWSSITPAVATVDDEGNVTMKATGTTYIYAYFDGNEDYAPAQCACMLTVSKKRPQIHFEQSSVKLELNATPYVFPALIKPDDLTDYYSWRSTSTKVATVDNSGNITILGKGYTQIQYLYDQGETQHDPKYLPDVARLDLTVTTSGVYVGNTYVMSSSPDVLGDGSVIYSTDNGETNLTLNDLNYDAGGGTFIRAVESTNLNVYVVGNCSITNASKAIETPGPLYIWCDNKKDTIFIDASHTAIQTGGMKVIDCYLFANGAQYGIYTNTFAVWAGGYIFAQGNTEAIRSYDFHRGQADIGGIQVLTKGVTFHEPVGEPTTAGFFTDYDNKVRAKFVEIGKIPLPVATDAVTDINFETDNPYDNLDVVFSESKDDQFNESEKQIEMNTVTTAEDVETASATYTTCSSDWLKALPGVLVFDLPSGEGEVEIECDIKAGSRVVVQVEGKGSQHFDTSTDGKITVSYNNAEQVHVVVYLQSSGSPAPKRIKAAKQEAPGVAIRSISIKPKGAPTAVINTTADQFVIKRIVNGQLLIERDGKTYNVQGVQVQ